MDFHENVFPLEREPKTKLWEEANNSYDVDIISGNLVRYFEYRRIIIPTEKGFPQKCQNPVKK